MIRKSLIGLLAFLALAAAPQGYRELRGLAADVRDNMQGKLSGIFLADVLKDLEQGKTSPRRPCSAAGSSSWEVAAVWPSSAPRPDGNPVPKRHANHPVPQTRAVASDSVSGVYEAAFAHLARVDDKKENELRHVTAILSTLNGKEIKVEIKKALDETHCTGIKFTGFPAPAEFPPAPRAVNVERGG